MFGATFEAGVEFAELVSMSLARHDARREPVADVLQCHRLTLRAALLIRAEFVLAGVGPDRLGRFRAGHPRLDRSLRRCLVFDLVASQGDKPRHFQHFDACDLPVEVRPDNILLADPFALAVPVDRIEDAARRRRRDDRVGEAFDLHLGPCEAGEVAPDFKRVGVDVVHGWQSSAIRRS